MFCECGATKSFVINSRPVDGCIKRQRRCASCGVSFHTKEERIIAEPKPSKPDKPRPVPDDRGLYTPKDATSLKMQKVVTRRKNEDRVSSYYIEDDYE